MDITFPKCSKHNSFLKASKKSKRQCFSSDFQQGENKYLYVSISEKYTKRASVASIGASRNGTVMKTFFGGRFLKNVMFCIKNTPSIDEEQKMTICR